MLRLSTVTGIILDLNSALDSGRYDDISIETVESRNEDGTILEFIENELNPFMLPGVDAESKARVVQHLQSIANAYSGNERRKWMVENRGLCLLIAWMNEIIQAQRWTIAE